MAGFDLRSGIQSTAQALGVSPVDLATIISYETAGTFDPSKAGPTTQHGQHRGLIQFGEPQAQQYGVDWNNPAQSQLGPDGAIAKYMQNAGVQPGMGILDLYSAVNAGRVGRYNASDANNGGAPGTVRDKVENQMRGHREKAAAMFGQPQVTREKPMQDGLLGQFGNQPGSDQKDLPFYQRDKFRDIAGGIASAANSLRHRPDPNLDARLAQAKQGRMQQQQTNKTVQWLQAQGRTDLAEAVGSGAMDPREAVGIMYRKDAGAEYGLTPQYITDADGKLKMIQLSKDGTAKEVELPEGAAIQKGVEKLDLGTHFQWHNTITGDPIGEPIPKNNRQAAADTAAGSAEGRAIGEDNALLDGMVSKMPGLINVVEQLGELGDKATYTMGGQLQDTIGRQLGMDPSEGALARTEYMAMVDNQVLPLLRETFGAAFTVQEGESLRATLGAPDKSPQEKRAVLRAFIEQKKRNIEALAGRTGRAAPPSGLPATGNGNDPLGIR